MAQAPKKEAKRRPTGALSPSVQSVVDHVPADEPVGSWDLVRALLERHREYGHGMAEKLLKDPGIQAGVRRSVADWLSGVHELFDPDRVPQLHGRLFIWGVALLDRELREHLSSRGFLDAISKELREPLDALLSERGSGALRGESAPSPETGATPDPTVLHADSPPERDQLGRRGFAEALALWISRFWTDLGSSSGRSFVIHIHGPWGSGKTTLLRLLERALKPRPPRPAAPAVTAHDQEHLQWIVVWFNAWRHQHIEPPWWPLLDTVYREGLRQTQSYGDRSRALRIRLGEILWRIRSGHKRHLLALVGSALVFAALVALLVAAHPRGGDLVETLATDAKALGAIFALLGAVWSGVLVLNRSLLGGTASSAQQFVDATQDPMQQLRTHFRRLVQRIGRPIMVYIDDLDRCRTAYAVSVLEGIQTLFSDSRVFYAIAADRRWLYVCFETAYSEFAPHIRQPGRRLGYLFLEKAFQLSVAVPRLSPQLQKQYLDYLVKGEQAHLEEVLQERRAEAAREFQDASSEDEIYGKLRHATGDGLYDQLRLEAAVRQMAAKQVEVQTQASIEPFAPLLEPNPRAMKRLVTAYGIHRALAMLRSAELVVDETRRRQLALWTIISLRWPALQEYLAEHPEKLDGMRDGVADSEVPEPLCALCQQPVVQDVLQGNADGVNASLSEEALRELLGLKEALSSAAVVA